MQREAIVLLDYLGLNSEEAGQIASVTAEPLRALFRSALPLSHLTHAVSERVGCNYSVHPALTLQVRAASIVLAWLTGMPPSGRLPGLRGYFQSHP